MPEYAHAEDVYKETRSVLGPWAQAHGFARWPDTVAGWQRSLDSTELLRFKFEGTGRAGDPDMGHALTGLVQLDRAGAGAAATPLRQRLLTSCLLRPEIDRLAALHATINRRRPKLPAQFQQDFSADSLLGLHLRSLYEPSPVYVEGQFVPLSYYSMDDVRETLQFVADVLPAVLERFVEGRLPAPVDTTPVHLKPKWLRGTR